MWSLEGTANLIGEIRANSLEANQGGHELIIRFSP